MVNRNVFALVLAVASTTQVMAQVTPPAVLTPTDPALRFWLKADSLVTAGLADGDPVKQWVDQSQYGTIMSPREAANPNGPLEGFPVEENPHLQYSQINGRSVPTVRFDRDGDIFETGDPAIDGSGSTDRLFQTNNLTPGFDPLDIGDGSSLTSFIVFNPTVTTEPALGPFQSVFAKRGSSSAVYQFGISPNHGGRFTFVNYDAPTVYYSEGTPEAQVWHTTSLTIEDNEGAADVDVINFYDDQSSSDSEKMVDVGVVGPDGVTPVTTIVGRNASTPEPFAMGGHSQNCCGEGETFAGNIAEIIIFARTLTAQEFSDVEDYLDAKYFLPAPPGTPGDYNENGVVDAADFTIFRDNQGALVALPNENPAAVTPGLVDDEDFAFWKANFGAGGGSLGATSAVPEPSCFVLIGSLLLLGAGRIRSM